MQWLYKTFISRFLPYDFSKSSLYYIADYHTQTGNKTYILAYGTCPSFYADVHDLRELEVNGHVEDKGRIIRISFITHIIRVSYLDSLISSNYTLVFLLNSDENGYSILRVNPFDKTIHYVTGYKKKRVSVPIIYANILWLPNRKNNDRIMNNEIHYLFWKIAEGRYSLYHFDYLSSSAMKKGETRYLWKLSTELKEMMWVSYNLFPDLDKEITEIPDW